MEATPSARKDLLDLTGRQQDECLAYLETIEDKGALTETHKPDDVADARFEVREVRKVRLYFDTSDAGVMTLFLISPDPARRADRAALDRLALKERK